MSHPPLNQQILVDLKRDAKKLTRDDPSRSYNQWLNYLSFERYGFGTFDSLRRRVEELQLEASKLEERERWMQRFAQPMVWEGLWDTTNQLPETWPLPVDKGSVPWPDCFVRSCLFTCAEGPRRQVDGELFSIDSPELFYRGEELRVDPDETVLMALISVMGKHACGRLVEFSCKDLDDAVGLPLTDWGMPVEYEEIAKTLWRLTHCRLVVNAFKFDGPILIFADARKEPERFAARFHPAFAHFYYPVLALLA